MKRRLTVLGHELIELTGGAAQAHCQAEGIDCEPGERLYVNASTEGQDGLTFSSLEDFLVQWCLGPGHWDGLTVDRLAATAEAYRKPSAALERSAVVAALERSECRRLTDLLLSCRSISGALSLLLHALATVPQSPDQLRAIARELP